MAFLFTNDLETGNMQIDKEHKQLINAINQLLEACSQGTGRIEIANTIDFLLEYTKTHFSHEEVLQQQSNYPDYENHKGYHESFIKIVSDLSNKLRTDGASIALVGEINSQLAGWLVQHIKTQDVKVAKHILENK